MAKQLSALIETLDKSRTGTTLGFHGNVIPLQIVTGVPSGTPPGNAGIQFQVVGTVVTVWVWDGTQWVSK